MGGLPALESLHRAPPPDTPPELVSPSATSFSSRSSPLEEQAAWGPRASVPVAAASMSRYGKASVDMSAEGNTDGGRGRQESVGTPTAGQQLPSLSSLFGPPSSMRPLNSPHTERPGIYPSPSPLDRPRISSSGNLLSSYFPQAISPSQPPSRSPYEFGGYNYSERQPTHATTSSLPASHSPEYPNHGHRGSDARYEPELPRKWSAYREDSRQEYLQPQEKLRPQYPGPKDPSHDYSERRLSQVHSSDTNTPSTSATVVTSEIAVSKDGLGPKIWTGTHFLPRFVRAAEVPGEGMCYFYDDGSHCKTVIDGEAVNAHWGVTKAGKPRKRLAIACVTCREKKIKCDPDYPRCVQCEKFGRVCKFKNAPRGGNNTSPSTSPAELDDGRQLETGDLRRSISDVSSPGSPRTGMRPASPDRGYSKRLKLGPEAYISNGEPPAPFNARMDYSKPRITEQPPPEPPLIPDEVLGRAWRTDPYASTPDLITNALTRFFANVDNTMILQFLPEEAFQRWVVSSRGQKSPEDLMLLYSTLAVGSALCGDPKQIAFEYAQVAHYAQKMTGVQCLQLVQSRILLAVYYISTCRTREADELISSAAASAACLQLSLELDHSRESGMAVYPLGLNRTGYAEARRRTLWSLFILERLSGLFPERPVMVNAEDIYTQLPTDLHCFEKQVESHARIFDPYGGLTKTDERSSDASVTGYYIEMVHIWSDCQAAIYRMALRRTSTETETAKLQDLIKRAKNWFTSLPPRLAFGGANLEAAAFTRSTGSFLSMHFLYHHTMIELNRHRHGAGQLPKDVQLGHSAECREHAGRVIEMLNSLDRILRVRSALLTIPPPAMAVAVTEAVDVLTATGPMTVLGDVIERVLIAKSAVDRTKNIWEASSKDRLAIDRRLQKLNRIRELGSRPPSPIQGYRLLPLSEDAKEKELNHWQILDPIEQTFPKDMDVIYVGLD
ncbi:transcriptional regulator family: Fungal Specific TF [Trichoderma harzianum]|nr:transcriptional regulator family: Fungal Specific TF [Trichoderma harzianum]